MGADLRAGAGVRALSLWQPHAQAIALGLKPWETRDWSTRYRGPLAIHAAKRPWIDSGGWHQDARQRLLQAMGSPMRLTYGAVVCVAELVDCVPTRELRGVIPAEHEFWGDFTEGEVFLGRFAFRLQNVRVLPEPLPVRGQQGFFDVPLPEFQKDTATLSLFGEMG
jgi:hypothetical protein